MPGFRIAALIISLTMFSAPGYSQSFTVATTGNGTAIYFYGLAVAKAAREIEGLDLRPKPFSSAGQGAVFVNRGEDDFGLFNAIVLREAYEGREFYAGRGLENLRLVARLRAVVPAQRGGPTGFEGFRGRETGPAKAEHGDTLSFIASDGDHGAPLWLREW